MNNVQVKKRPPIVTKIHPENDCIAIKKKHQIHKPRLNESPTKPLFLLVGDSTLKHVTSYDLKKNCNNANIMVRSVQGSKLKNIINLVIDTLEDVTLSAICIHAGTNDVSNGITVDQISEEMENLIRMIMKRGIHIIVSLLTHRNDRFMLIDLSKRLDVSNIEHRNINKNKQ